MKPELRNRIIKYNKAMLDNANMANDMKIIAEEMAMLPPGQLKKILNSKVISILGKYGVTFE